MYLQKSLPPATPEKISYIRHCAKATTKYIVSHLLAVIIYTYEWNNSEKIFLLKNFLRYPRTNDDVYYLYK